MTPYAIPFGRRLAARGGPQLEVMITAAQSGKTETFLDVIGERLDNRPAPILFVGPSREFLTDQFEPRLRALFVESESLGAKIVGGVDGKRQKKLLKRVAGVPVRLATSGSSTALKSDHAALALLDEYDEMVRALRDQGDILGLVMARGTTHADFKCGVTSTPSQGIVDTEFDADSGLEFWAVAEPDDVSSPIWRLWQGGTRHHWCWPCPHCARYFVPRRDLMRYPDDASPDDVEAAAVLECPRCKATISNDRKSAMNARGVAVAPGEKVLADGTILGRPRAGAYGSLWVSGLCSPFVSFGKRVRALVEAERSREGAKIQTAINAGFGECSPPLTADVPDAEEILTRKGVGLPAGRVHPDALVVVAAVDVQKLSLPYAIRAFGARDTSWLVAKGALHGPTKDEDIWNELGALLTAPVDGRPIKLALVDSGFRPGEKLYLPINRVYEFCRRYRRFVFATKGASTPLSKPLIERAIEVETHDGSNRTYGLRLLRLDTDHWKSTVHERLSLDGDAPGALHLNADVDEDYCRQLVSEVRVSKPGGGFMWLRQQKANHYLDIEAMLAAAAWRLNLQDFTKAAQGSVRLVPSTRVAAANIESGGGARSRRRPFDMGALARRLNR